MTKTEINMINTTSLAYLGDAVYEVIVREMILAKYPLDAGKAHQHAVRYVSAGGQAKAARAMIEKGFLTEEEEHLLKRARNHRTMSRPQHADPKDYKYATGFEALLGYLHLAGEKDRIAEITSEAFRIIEE
ncbi:MAG: Mini-ribonuclease 3 [Mogibacterium sp.]|nr:Mini-ribonuclease 3 [Mogibacterium sp.]